MPPRSLILSFCEVAPAIDRMINYFSNLYRVCVSTSDSFTISMVGVTLLYNVNHLQAQHLEFGMTESFFWHIGIK